MLFFYCLWNIFVPRTCEVSHTLLVYSHKKYLHRGNVKRYKLFFQWQQDWTSLTLCMKYFLHLYFNFSRDTSSCSLKTIADVCAYHLHKVDWNMQSIFIILERSDLHLPGSSTRWFILSSRKWKTGCWYTPDANSGFIKQKSRLFVQIDTPFLQPYYERRNGWVKLFSEWRGLPLELQRKRYIHKIIYKLP